MQTLHNINAVRTTFKILRILRKAKFFKQLFSLLHSILTAIQYCEQLCDIKIDLHLFSSEYIFQTLECYVAMYNKSIM